MNRSRLRIVATLAAAALVGACSDASPTSPAASPTLSWKSTSVSGGSSKTVTFTVYPGLWSQVNIDEHRIIFEPNAICDMGRTAYGPEHWDEPCPVAPRGVRITARAWHDDAGRPVVDFQPALRFNPASRVTLYLRERSDDNDALAKILYVSPDGSLVDEAIADPTVATRTAPNGFKYRRVKHFSGYTLLSGRLGSYELDLLRGGASSAQLGVQQLSGGHVVATGAIPDEKDQR